MAVYDHQPGFVIDSLTSDAYRTDLAVVLEELPARARVLELGCGSGSFTQWLHTNQLDVTGVDRSEAQLAEARQHLPDVPFTLCDIETDSGIDILASTHALFDLLISRYVIHELSDPIEAFTRWGKLLKPTGRLVLIENAWNRSDWGSSDWGQRTDSLPLACTQTWATAVYCLKKAGYSAVAAHWMRTLNALESMRIVSGFRLYCISATFPKQDKEQK